MIIKLDKYTILIDDDTMKEIITLQKGDHKKESGGIVLGSITNDFRIIIRSIPKATNNKVSSKYSCVRDKQIAQKIINDSFQKSNGIVTYIGEWHTHPVDIPTYSSQDKKTLKEQFSSNNIGTNFLLMLIIGRKNIELSIYSEGEILSANNEIPNN